MKKEVLPGILFSLFVVFCAWFAGCSDDSSPEEIAGVTATVPAGPAYGPGDIIATPSTASASSLFLILGYDPVSDTYTRAFIEKNPDGSWGYRPGNRTEKSPRAVVERVYTVRVARVAVSSVRVVTPTEVTAAGTPAGSSEAPVIGSISPSYAAKGSAMSFSITGKNFREGATVRLIIAGSAPIPATGVQVSPSVINGVFDLKGKYDGVYNLIVTNPDGQSDQEAGAFTIGEALPVITSVNPITSPMNKTVPVTVYGQNFRNNIRVTFTKNTTELICMNPLAMDSLKISCNLNLHFDAGALPGEWTVTVLNVDTQKKAVWTRKFTVTNATGT